MESRSRIYILEPILDDPRYEGFGTRDRDYSRWLPMRRPGRDWKVNRLAEGWIPPKLIGKVRDFNDYPCLGMSFPLFSMRAVNALRDFLEPNGELLPVIAPTGEYLAFNLTTVADVLDWKKSKIEWIDKPTLASVIIRHEFFFSKMKKLSIFRLPENPTSVYVTQAFVDRAYQHGLGGLNFQIVHPVPRNTNWLILSRKQYERHLAGGLPKGQTLKGQSAILRLHLATSKSRGNATIKNAVDVLLDQLDELLIDATSKAPVVGSLEGHDFQELGNCRIFFSCPDASALVKKLRPWLKKLRWPNGFSVVKRACHFGDVDALEKPVRI